MQLENLENKLIIIAGGGSFGAKAVIITKSGCARVIVLDNKIDCEASKFVNEIVKEEDINKVFTTKAGSAILLLCDAVEVLVRLMKITTPDYIIPAIPGHLAGKVAKKWLEHKGLAVKSGSKAMKNVVKDIPASLIIHHDESVGVIITSYMLKGTLCKVPCNQPPDFCLTTGRLKIGPMHRILAFASHNKVSLSKILIGRMLGEEVGYIQGPELRSLLLDAEKLKVPYSLSIGTACDCHGILNLFLVCASR